ncbi:hypothetical protein [Lachnoclostridium sp.]|uniref:hypothetical protein n=1 Tax=Lachnoclostridium sp. TaxID=2028282 RepID=UPI0026D35ABF|nr:hypothetical protein [Lachnoclostridium sp.]
MKKEVMKCICKRTKCERHGKCEECITHHNENKKSGLPYCQRKTKKDNTNE